MKTSGKWNFRSIVGRIIPGLVIAAMIGSMDVVPALAKDGHKGKGRHDNGRYEKKGRGHDRGHYEYDHGRRVYRPYGYYAPPPPVFYAPQPHIQPGISIMLPSIYIH